MHAGHICRRGGRHGRLSATLSSNARDQTNQCPERWLGPACHRRHPTRPCFSKSKCSHTPGAPPGHTPTRGAEAWSGGTPGGPTSSTWPPRRLLRLPFVISSVLQHRQLAPCRCPHASAGRAWPSSSSAWPASPTPSTQLLLTLPSLISVRREAAAGKGALESVFIRERSCTAAQLLDGLQRIIRDACRLARCSSPLHLSGYPGAPPPAAEPMQPVEAAARRLAPGPGHWQCPCQGVCRNGGSNRRWVGPPCALPLDPVRIGAPASPACRSAAQPAGRLPEQCSYDDT